MSRSFCTCAGIYELIIRAFELKLHGGTRVRRASSTTVLQNMWGRLQPAAGFSPRMPQREMRILLLPLHLMMHAVVLPPSSAPLCDCRTTICHIPSARHSANRQGVSQRAAELGKGICLPGPAAG